MKFAQVITVADTHRRYDQVAVCLNQKKLSKVKDAVLLACLYSISQ